MTIVIIYETFCHAYARFFVTRNNVVIKISIKNNVFVPVNTVTASLLAIGERLPLLKKVDDLFES